MADALSKGNMEEVRREMPWGRDVSHWVSRVLFQWIGDPRVDRILGRKSLLEISWICEVVLGFG